MDAFIIAIFEALAQERKIQLIRFGTFEVRERSARKARNPKTGKVIAVAPSKVPVFKPAKELKEAFK